MQNTTTAEELAEEIATLKQQLVTYEAKWEEWRKGNIYLTAQARTEGLHMLRDRIHVLEAKLVRTKR